MKIKLTLCLFSLLVTVPSFAFKNKFQCALFYPIEVALLKFHVKFSDVTPELHDRTVDQFIKSFDPTKVYFLKSDVDNIKKDLAKVFDKVKDQDCTDFQKAQKIYVERLKERVAFASQVLKDSKFALNKKDEFIFDPETKKYPETKAEAESFLKDYIQFQVANYVATDIKLPEAKKRVIKNWEKLEKKVAETSADDLNVSFAEAFARALDPHTQYLPPQDSEDFQIQMSLSLQGIGATLSSPDGITTIESLVTGGPADRSGLLQPQDKIMAVAQGKGKEDTGKKEKSDGKLGKEFENVVDMDLQDVVRKIRGAKGSVVRLSILRKSPEGKKRFVVTLIRDQVKLEDEAASISYIDKDIGGEKHKLGLVNFPSFYADSHRNGRSSAADLKRIIAEAQKEKAEGLVLDLSRNGGGSLEDAVKIAGLFFATGNVVKQTGKRGAKEEIVLRDVDAQVNWAGPLVILTSRISASASEIVAGTLKGYKRALIVGSDHTFGKGTVQQYMELPPNTGEFGAIKVTIGMFYVADGESTQHRGVASDVKLISAFDTDEIGEKKLEYSLPPAHIDSFLSPEVNPKTIWKPITGEWVTQLSTQSQKRVADDPEFKKIQDDLDKLKANGKKIKISEILSGTGKEEVKKAKALRNASKADREKEYVKRPDIQESLNVLVDLVQLENGKKLVAYEKTNSVSEKREKAGKEVSAPTPSPKHGASPAAGDGSEKKSE